MGALFAFLSLFGVFTGFLSFFGTESAVVSPLSAVFPLFHGRVSLGDFGHFLEILGDFRSFLSFFRYF